MKRNICSNVALVILAVAMGFSSGCKKRPGHVVPLPGSTTGVIPNPTPDGPSGKLPPEGNPLVNTDATSTGLPPSEHGDISRFTNRSALAEYVVHFDLDRSTIKSSEKNKVDAVASYLKANAGADLLIEGHCDERGTDGYNLGLGERRALALREALVGAGIAASRIQTVSYGEARPVEPGHNEAAWSKNRRGEFVVSGK